MRFEVHAAGTRGPATLLFTCETFAEAFAKFEGLPETRATAPAGQASEPDPAEPWAIVPSGTAEELAPLGNLYQINPRYSGGCYILSEGGGVSCLGFAVAERWRAETLAWLEAEAGPHAFAEYLARAGLPYETGFPLAGEVLPGSPEAYARYLATMAAGRDLNARTGKRCEAELVPQLRGLEGKRVEVVDAHGERRRFIVGRSTGWRPCHLEIATRGSHGGGPVWGAPFASVRVVEARR